MKLFSILFVTILSLNVSANDGGLYYIPVEKIEKVDLKKNQDLYYSDSETVYTFEGKKADILRRSLPAILSVDAEMTKHSNSLYLVDEKGKASIDISCTNATRDDEGKLVKFGTTKCTVSFNKSVTEGSDVYDMLGDAQELTAPSCSEK